MPVGGYDPEDLDDKLSGLMDADGRDHSNWLTDAEHREWKQGGSLVDLLDGDDIRDLLETGDAAE